MSNVVSFTARVDQFRTTGTSFEYREINKDNLFPNSTAKPIKADFSITIRRDPWYVIIGVPTGYGVLQYNGQDKCSLSSTNDSDHTASKNNDTAVNNNKANTTVRAGVRVSKTGNGTTLVVASATFYFNQYEFTASAGTGINAAGVSTSTGYDGDTITFSCVLTDGATFDGWYNGSTRVSTSQTYNLTVNGADVTLTAKASLPSKVLSVTYNGAQVSGFPIAAKSDVEYMYGETMVGKVRVVGDSKTIHCGLKKAGSNIRIANKTLLCTGKYMATDIVMSIS